MAIPLRVALPILVFLVACIVCIATFIPLYLSGRDTGNEFSSSMREELGARIGSQTLALFSPYEALWDSVNSLTKFDVFDAATSELEIAPKICDAYRKTNFSTYIGMTNGTFIRCKSLVPGYFIVTIRHLETFSEYTLDSNLSMVSTNVANDTLSKPYDPRARPWYSDLSGGFAYSSLYLNFSESGSGTSAITSGGPIMDSNQQLIGILGTDNFPTDVVEFFADGVKVAKSGHALLVEDKGAAPYRVLGASFEVEELKTALVDVSDVIRTKNPDATDAAEAAMECDLPLNQRAACSFQFDDGRDAQYVEAVRPDITGQLPYRLILIVPESDFLSEIWARGDITIVIVVVVVVVILVLAVIVATLLLGPLSAITKTMEGLSDFSNLDTDSVEESVFSEVRSVQTALKRVVVQMKELKKFIPQTVLMDEWSDFEEEDDLRSMGSASYQQDKKRSKRRNSDSMDTTPPLDDSTDKPRESSQNLPHFKNMSPSNNPLEGLNSPNQHGAALVGIDKASRGSASDLQSNLERQASLKLNTKKLTKSVNNFTHKRCSILIAELNFTICKNKAEIQEAVKQFMESVISAALQFKGVIEVLRPEVLIITFSSIMHETNAVNAAVRIAQLCSKWAGLDMVTVAVDSGEYLRGNCGARDRMANVVFGPMMVTMRRLPQLAHIFKGTMLLITEGTARKADPEGFMLFPVDVISPKHNSALEIRLYDICPKTDSPDFNPAIDQVDPNKDKFQAHLCKTAFNLFLDGQPEKAIESLRLPDGQTDYVNPHCKRILMKCAKSLELAKSGKKSTDLVVRREAFPWEEKGDLHQQAGENHDDYVDFSSRFLAEDENLGDFNSSMFGGGDANNVKSMIRDAQNTIKEKEKKNVPVFNFFGGGDDDNDGGDDGGGGPMFSMFGIAAPNDGDSQQQTGEATSQPAEEEEQDEVGFPVTFKDSHQRNWHRSELVLGKGTFGAVYQGMSDQGVLAALKFLELKSDMQLADLEVEVDALCQLENENIVQFISAAVTKKYLIFALEYVPGGSLVSMMEAYELQLPPKIVKKFGRDILQGLQYLHSQSVVHCDIKPGNVLIAGDGTCKITDFGSAVIGAGSSTSDFVMSVRPDGQNIPGDGKTNDTGLRGTLKYMAPEVADSTAPSAPSDIWSFGISLCEIATGNIPWMHLPKIGQLAFLSKNADRQISPEIPPCVAPTSTVGISGRSVNTPDRVPEALRDLLSKCWMANPDDRPSAAELLSHPYFEEV